MSSTRIESLLAETRNAFDRRPDDIEDGLNVESADVLQFRKACRLLAGAAELLDAGYFTLVIESSFVAIERTIEFRLLERGEIDTQNLSGSHTGVYRDAAEAGVFSESTANELQDLWRDHRAKTYYQDGLAAYERARKMHALAMEVHAFVIGRSEQGYECLCDS